MNKLYSWREDQLVDDDSVNLSMAEGLSDITTKVLQVRATLLDKLMLEFLEKNDVTIAELMTASSKYIGERVCDPVAETEELILIERSTKQQYARIKWKLHLDASSDYSKVSYQVTRLEVE